MVRAVDKQSNTKGLEDVLAPFKNGKGDRLVLDQLIYSFTRGGTDFGVDYAVCHPTAACYLRGARDKCLAAAESRGQGKVAKYDPACRTGPTISSFSPRSSRPSEPGARGWKR